MKCSDRRSLISILFHADRAVALRRIEKRVQERIDAIVARDPELRGLVAHSKVEAYRRCLSNRALVMKNPPTGIIRTLPSLYTDPKNPGWRGLRRSIAACERSDSAYFYLALAQRPKHEVLHLYLLVGNQITMRFNIAGYAPGHVAKCWDGAIRQPKLWVICTGPVSRPPEPIKRRGFQGFRYTEDLW